jgi:hypothetical protein
MITYVRNTHECAGDTLEMLDKLNEKTEEINDDIDDIMTKARDEKHLKIDFEDFAKLVGKIKIIQMYSSAANRNMSLMYTQQAVKAYHLSHDITDGIYVKADGKDPTGFRCGGGNETTNHFREFPKSS